jgi:hypothetical protein
MACVHLAIGGAPRSRATPQGIKHGLENKLVIRHKRSNANKLRKKNTSACLVLYGKNY